MEWAKLKKAMIMVNQNSKKNIPMEIEIEKEKNIVKSKYRMQAYMLMKIFYPPDVKKFSENN